jgi:hypothetical protein
MRLNKMIKEIDNSIDNLFDYYSKFNEDPESFNIFSGEQIAYKIYYQGDDNIKYESALIFLKYMCGNAINSINTCKLLINAEVITGTISDESLEIYNDLINETIDSVISMQLEVETLLKGSGGKVNSDITRKKGRKAKSINILDASQQAILFYYLAEVEAIDGKGNKSEVARAFSRMTGAGFDHAKKTITDGPKEEARKNIISKLEQAIKLIKEY